MTAKKQNARVPKVGDIILYFPNGNEAEKHEAGNNGLESVPGMVLRVLENNVVNLIVFPEGLGGKCLDRQNIPHAKQEKNQQYWEFRD